ncbi:MAG TPA: hypothetical protein VGB52_09005 [Actinomycetota bacterium]|jgi:hypothetical protein
MRHRLMLAAALAAVTALPIVGAQAEASCDTPIYLFSNFRVQTGQDDPQNPGNELQPGNPSVASTAAGCDVIAEDFPETPWDDRDSDYIYPGSNNFTVRWLEGSLPVSGTIEFAGATYQLTFDAGQGTLGDQVDSRRVFFPQDQSIGGGDAVVTVCRTTTSCETKTFRTVDQGPR